MQKHGKMLCLRCAAAALLAAMLLTSCAGSAANFDKQMELGRKYFTELNYAEAIAAFTEAIRLDPNDIEAYFERAQAYAALKKYDEANADYTAVIEKTDAQPYLQASAYVGRAGVGEETENLADAESDYAAALVLLGDETAGKDSSTDADKVLTLKKETLAKHAAVCVTLALLDKAAGDYDQLEELGQNVAAERSELEKLRKDAPAEDTENSLPDSDTPELQEETDAEEAASSKEQPAEHKTEEAASSNEQPAESKKEEAASSNEQPAESKKEEAASSNEQPAESKKEEAASSQVQTAGQPQSYTAKKTAGYTTITEKVNYQIGGTTIRLTHNEDLPWTDEGVQYTSSSIDTCVYTLSQPLQGMERKGDWQVIWDVPTGTVISRTRTYTSLSDGVVNWESSGTGMLCLVTTRVLSEDEVETWGDVAGDESVTVEKGKLYQMIDVTEGGVISDVGGFIFRGV